MEISRELYDHHDKESSKYKTEPGLNEETVTKISVYKHEPDWMLKKRLTALKIFNELKLPTWGPNLEKLDLNKITYFNIPDAKQNADSWDKVPEEIKKTFERLGIPEAERKALSGAGAQYDSQVVYHNIREDLKKKGVVFEDMDIAVKEYPEMVKRYFMTTCISPSLHKFAALHGAVFSGGTYIHVPKDVKVDMPLQAYFRMNTKSMGQFEHTLIIVDEGAELHYIEGCFTAGNLVATNPDYKNIEDIKENDRILTSEGDFKKAKDLQKYDYSGYLYDIKIYGDSTQSISSTPDHEFLYIDKKKPREKNSEFIPRWNIPKYFKQGDYLVMPINSVVKSKKTHEFKVAKYIGHGKYEDETVVVKLTPGFFRLVGYYLAEGSTMKEHYLCFDFNKTERGYINDVKKLLKKIFDVKPYEVPHRINNSISVRLNSTRLARLFKQFGDRCNNKKLPSWIMYEKKEHQAEIINGWFRGDGNYYNKQHRSGLKELFRINTTSYTLARQGRDIMLRLGVFAFINARNRKKEGRLMMYTLGITGIHMLPFSRIVGIHVKNKIHNHKRATRFGIDNKFAYVPIRSITERKVKNISVYNFGVNIHETYTVAGVAVHNCSAPVYTTSSIHAGCVEIFVHKNARMRYSSVENWSKNTYNLNTKRAMVEENAVMEWISGNFGSRVSMLYPASFLIGKNASANHISIAYAGKDQNQDTGAKIYHLAPNTTSVVKSKSISKDGGITTYRGIVKIGKNAFNSKSSVNCDALMFDNKSQSNTYPVIDVDQKDSDIVHEASVGKISEEQIFYLMSRGLGKEQAVSMIVSGFIEPLIRELPMEYAVEMNRLIEMEMEGSLG